MKMVLFDLGDTLESDGVLRPGALATLQELTDLRAGGRPSVVLGLHSDYRVAAHPANVPGIVAEYYALLDELGIRRFFEPLSRRVTKLNSSPRTPPPPATGQTFCCARLLSNGTSRHSGVDPATREERRGVRVAAVPGRADFQSMHSCPTTWGRHANGPTTVLPPDGMAPAVSSAVSIVFRTTAWKLCWCRLHVRCRHRQSSI